MEFELPNVLPGDISGLMALRSQILAAFNTLRGAELTATSADSLKALRDAAEIVHAEIAKIKGADATIGELDALLAEDEAPVAEAPVAETVVDEPVVEPQFVAASFAGRGGDAAPVVTRDAAPTAGWRIRPDAPNYNSATMGGLQKFSQVKEALNVGTTGFVGTPNGKMEGEYSSQMIASYHRNVTFVEDYEDLNAALDASVKDMKQSDGTLNAAAWCAPPETDYSFCDVPPAVELFSVREVANKRGSLQFPIEPAYNGALQVFCEPQLATAVKTCVTIPCPGMETLKLCALPLCLTVDILQDSAWPELTAYYSDLIVQTNLRQRASWLLNAALLHPDTATLVIPGAGQLGAAASLLNSITIGATRLRYLRNLHSETIIEATLPTWAKEVIRGDIANQGGIAQYEVTNAQINRWLAARFIAPKFIGHWQTLGATTDEFPPTIDILLNEAGSFFALTKPVVNLGVQYHRELLQVNTFQKYFIEDGLALGQRCGGALKLTVPVCASGEIGERGLVTCPATGSS